MRKNLKYKEIKANEIFTRPRTLKTISLLSIVVLGLTLIPVGLLMDNDLMSKRNDQEIGRRDHSVNTLKISDIDYFNKDVVCQNYSFYMWNLTNSEDYILGSKPQFEEIGPFIFRDHNYRENITYNGDETEVNHETYDRFEYLQDVSYNNLDITSTNIRNINPGYLGTLRTMKAINENAEMGLFQTMFPDMMRRMKEEVLVTTETELVENKQTMIDTYGVGIAYMPQPHEVFYSEWMRDRMPMIEILLQGLEIWLDPNTGELEFLGLGIIDPVDYIGDVDIDGMKDPEKYNALEGKSRPDDLNMKDFDAGYSNSRPRDLAVTQLCEALWDPTREYSLTYNPDVEETGGLLTTEHWFKLAGLIDATSGEKATSKALIEAEFSTELSIFNSEAGMSEDVIDDLIAPWIYRSLMEVFPHVCPPRNKLVGDLGYGWMYNIALWTFDKYDGNLICERTIHESLFSAFDGIINQSKFEYQRARAHVGFFRTAASYDEAYISGLSEVQGGQNLRKLNIFNVKTGKNNVIETCQISALNGMQYENSWPQPETIRGTDGYKFHPNIQTSDILEILDINIMNRVMKFEYIDDYFLNGVTVYRYQLDSYMWTVNADYDQHNELINLTPIRYAPIYVSQPHFLNADYSFVDAVSGLSPNGILHDHYIEVEPKSGITADIKLRLQYNIEVGPTDLFYKDIYTGSGGTTFMPLLWFEKSNIPDFDNDTIPDAWEAFHAVDDINADPDNDSLTNLQEFHEYTDPNDEDSDDDKINDFDDPYPLHNLDLDTDGMSDDWEAFYGVDDPNGDPDGDGKTNLEEFLAGTNPIIYNKPDYNKPDGSENENPSSEPPFFIIFIIIIIGTLLIITNYTLISILMKRKYNAVRKMFEKKGIKGVASKPITSPSKFVLSAIPEKKEIKSVPSKPNISHTKTLSSEKHHVQKEQPFFPPKRSKIGVYCTSCHASHAITREQFDHFSCGRCGNYSLNVGYFCRNCNKIYPLSKKDFTDLKEPEKVLCFKCNNVAEIFKKK